LGVLLECLLGLVLQERGFFVAAFSNKTFVACLILYVSSGHTLQHIVISSTMFDSAGFFKS